MEIRVKSEMKKIIGLTTVLLLLAGFSGITITMNFILKQ